MNIRKHFIIDPCSKKGNCLVRPSCRLLNNPWNRKDNCPTYAKYVKRDELVDSIAAALGSLCFACVLLVICAAVIVAFVLGIIREYQLIRDWLF